MQFPIIRGVIDRRVLVNFRLEPGVAAAALPAPFRPNLTRGTAMAGICLIRLRGIRPEWVPVALGVSSENAAHRIAVEWDTPQGIREGVFIPRRDTDSRLNAWLGGRLFPGLHNHARFELTKGGGRYDVAFTADDGSAHARVVGREDGQLPESSCFRSPAEASAFFRGGSIGWSPSHTTGVFEGLELRCHNWDVRPLAVESVESDFFNDSRLFPPGSVEFDCALVMRGIEHEWHACGEMDVLRRVTRTSRIGIVRNALSLQFSDAVQDPDGNERHEKRIPAPERPEIG